MIRFAIIGTNWITDRFLESAAEIKDVELTAVYSRSAERAAEFAANHGAEFTFSNLQEMAASDCFDAGDMASPNARHKE
ncbi:Gfo/Idh/MocA family oxidoreductase, partial [Bacillus vallismortis]|uniref:Gfo/Idh/MocA family oxidoreductase n=1 Tax=Bacillus vallismortis TaxID=72361 RepID=UPI00227EA83D